jgi:anti-sigma B factor antagonist
MQVRVSKMGIATYLVPDGAMIENNLQPLKDSTQTALQGGASKIVLDLRRVPLLDSRGLEFLLDLAAELRKNGGALRLANANALCRDILAITRMDQAVPTFENLEGASESFL